MTITSGTSQEDAEAGPALAWPPNLSNATSSEFKYGVSLTILKSRSCLKHSKKPQPARSAFRSKLESGCGPNSHFKMKKRESNIQRSRILLDASTVKISLVEQFNFLLIKFLSKCLTGIQETKAPASEFFITFFSGRLFYCSSQCLCKESSTRAATWVKEASFFKTVQVSEGVEYCANLHTKGRHLSAQYVSEQSFRDYSMSRTYRCWRSQTSKVESPRTSYF